MRGEQRRARSAASACGGARTADAAAVDHVSAVGHSITAGAAERGVGRLVGARGERRVLSSAHAAAVQSQPAVRHSVAAGTGAVRASADAAAVQRAPAVRHAVAARAGAAVAAAHAARVQLQAEEAARVARKGEGAGGGQRGNDGEGLLRADAAGGEGERGEEQEPPHCCLRWGMGRSMAH